MRNRAVEADLATYADKIGTDTDVQQHWKSQLMTNREVAVKVLAKMPSQAAAAPPRKRMHNRGQTTVPDSLQQTAEENLDDVITKIRVKNKCTSSEAYQMAKVSHPQLF